MRLRHIEVIQALLQTGHLGTAAEWLQLPVAEVERTLRDAEDQLGFMLFASVRGRLQATREARELQVEIAHVYEALEPVQRAIHQVAPGPETVVRIAGDFRQPGHRPLERVGVQIGHARQQRTA